MQSGVKSQTEFNVGVQKGTDRMREIRLVAIKGRDLTGVTRHSRGSDVYH
jgi:hypothetical protein